MRILLCVGCNAYEHAYQLTGAERDARRVFELLIKENVGEYDPQRSRLLLSPTVDQVRQAVRDVLFAGGAIDTFTFFFAGHGGLRAGSFYMWLRDTKPEAQSLSAFSLSDLFLSLNESSPAQSNVIIDACESGGLIADLGVLLKTELIGNAGTPGVTLVATAAKDQASGETSKGGFGTIAIIDCIEGRDLVNDSASALDLIEIGRRVSDRLRDSGQNPVVWGLNLYGPRRFCRNPYYRADPASPLRQVMQASAPGADAHLRGHYERLWTAYSSVSGEFDPRAFSNVISAVLTSLKESPDALADFAERFGAAVLERGELSDDPFRPAFASATVAVCLLPYIEHVGVDRAAHRLLDSTAAGLMAAGSLLADDLKGERFALLSKRGGGLADLFYLPLRVSKVLGWMAAAVSILRDSGGDHSEASSLFMRLLQKMLDDYDGSLTAMSDAQAPYLAMGISCAAHLGRVEEAEQLVGHLYNSFLSCRGNVARFDIPPERVFEYLVARRDKDFAPVLDLVERPNETLAVLLRAATLLDLEDVFDEDLSEIDGLSFTAHITSDFSQFGNEIMRGGKNLVWAIGHDVFRVADFVKTWPAPSPRPSSNLVESLVITASLLYPDRVPWFCFEQKQSAVPTGPEAARLAP